MQNLAKLINEAKKKTPITDQHIFNMIREYLQVLILKAIYQSKYGKGMSFIGGTCLRICYNLKRYSEDLDFTLDQKISGYSFQEFNQMITTFLKSTDFEVDINVSEEKVVQKSFIRISNVLHVFGFSGLKSQKLHIKLKIDTNPVKINPNEKEVFFVTNFDENFPILKHTKDTLFAGKICAVLNRGYNKGRDFYDLIWYLNHGVEMNVSYINRSFQQAGLTEQFKNKEDVLQGITKKVEQANIDDIMKDIGRFLEDPTEFAWISNYPTCFKQAAERYLGS